MIDLLQKARDGRNIALAGLSVDFRKTILGGDTRREFRPNRAQGSVLFASRRPAWEAAWVH